MEVLESLERLVSPFGVVSAVKSSVGWSPESLHGFAGTVGVLPEDRGDSPVACAGRSLLSPDDARLKAIAEGAERYAAADILGEERVRRSGDDVRDDQDFLEPWRYPACSPSEYGDPRCPLRPFDGAQPIRWSPGVDMRSGRKTWVPSTMATYQLGDKTESERFSYDISTGFAVHTRPDEAALRGLLEVVERDMVSLVWLQRLRLPLVDDDARSESVVGLIAWLRQRFVETYLFDATSDLNVPTVYCLLTSEYDDRCSQVVGAAAGRRMCDAAEKAVLEAVSIMRIVRERRKAVAGPEDIGDVLDGASYMGERTRSGAFDFLTEGAEKRRRRCREPLPESATAALKTVVDRLHRLGYRAVRVDRTVKELREAGLTAVNMVVPDLQPMSLDPFAQFKAHPRLYEAPARMGYGAHGEEELNPWPQPFA